jgi:hypothetical protein
MTLEPGEAPIEPRIVKVTDGWAAIGYGWAVIGPTVADAIDLYREAEAWHAEIAAREVAVPSESSEVP